MQTKNLNKPKFRLYATTSKKVDIQKAKVFVVRRYGAEDVTAVQGTGGNSLILSARAGNFSNLWKYLTKKRGVVSVRIGN